ncbi:hypothetical protein [Methylorubrum extorquens]
MTEPHKRLPAYSLEARRRMVAHLRPVVAPMSGEEIRLAVRDDEKNDSQLRTDLGHIRSNDAGRHIQIGEKRLFWLCERLGVDPWLALSGAPAPLTVRRVH